MLCCKFLVFQKACILSLLFEIPYYFISMQLEMLNNCCNLEFKDWSGEQGKQVLPTLVILNIVEHFEACCPKPAF